MDGLIDFKTNKYGRKTTGFTLPELLITLAVMAIILTAAVPGMSGMLNQQELRSKVNLFTTSLAYARNEAVARVKTVSLCGSNGSSQCSGTSDLSNGWLIFLDQNSNGVLETASGDELLKTGGQEGGTISLTLASSSTSITYSDSGEVSSVRTLNMCSDDASSDPSRSRKVVISIVGSARVSTGASCP